MTRLDENFSFSFSYSILAWTNIVFIAMASAVKGRRERRIKVHLSSQSYISQKQILDITK